MTREGRPALWPRHLRHEGLRRRGAGRCAENLRSAQLATPIHLAASPMTRRSAASACAARWSADRECRCKPKGCIIGEPTEMQVTIAHKGKKSMRCHVHGIECHSSLAPKGVNAVEYAAEVIAYLKSHGARASRPKGRSITITTCRTRRCIPASSRAAPRSTSCPRIAASISSSAICRGTIPRRCWREVKRFAERQAAAGDARHRRRMPASPGSRSRPSPASTRADDAEITRARQGADPGQ